MGDNVATHPAVSNASAPQAPNSTPPTRSARTWTNVVNLVQKPVLTVNASTLSARTNANVILVRFSTTPAEFVLVGRGSIVLEECFPHKRNCR